MEAPPPPPKQPTKKLTLAEVGQVVNAAYNHSRAENMRAEIAAQLGVSALVLQKLKVGCGFDEFRKQWFTSWPERNHEGRYVGMVRRYSDGAKRTYPGTTHGVVYADGWRRIDKVLFLPEGGSDTAAIMSLGLPVIGRPSNLGGVSHLAKLLKGMGTPVVVLGEDDRKQGRECGDCMECGLCWPGMFGARETAKRLAQKGFNAWWAILPGAKDSRAWINANHPTAEEFIQAARESVRKA